MCRIAWCSIFVVMMWSFPFAASFQTVPLSAQLSDSVPLPVKNISSCEAPSTAATCSRALVMAFLFLSEKEYMDEGLPKDSVK